MVAELKESAITVWPETSCVQTDLKQEARVSPMIWQIVTHLGNNSYRRSSVFFFSQK